MKRGAIIGLEALVNLIPHILITVALIFILGMFVNSFLSSGKTVEDQDFIRISAEITELMKAPSTISVPISNPQSMTLGLFAQENAPSNCKNLPCFCMEYYKEKKPLLRCQPYDKLQPCSFSDCSKPCFEPNIQPIELTLERKSVTLTRKCNVISLT